MYSRGRQDETANALRDSTDEETRSDAMAYALCFEIYFNPGGRGEELPIKSSVDAGISGLLLGAEARPKNGVGRGVQQTCTGTSNCFGTVILGCIMSALFGARWMARVFFLLPL